MEKFTAKTSAERNAKYREKNKSVKIFLPNSEFEILKERAKEYRFFSQYARDCLMNNSLKEFKKNSKINRELLYELHKIGVNLNQVSKKVNSAAQYRIDKDEVNKMVKDTNILIETFLKKYL